MAAATSSESPPPDAAPAPPASEPTPEPATEPAATPTPAPAPATARTRRTWRQAGPLLVLRAAHPKQAFLTAAGVAAAAALAGRPTRELGLVFVTVLVGQAIVGWHNDLVDRTRDAANEVPGKPVAEGLLEPGTVWFAIACATLLVVPLVDRQRGRRGNRLPPRRRRLPGRQSHIPQGLAVVAAVGRLLRPLPRLPVLRRVGRCHGGEPARDLDHRAGRAAGRLRPLPEGAPGARRGQPGRLPAPAAAGRAADRGTATSVDLDRAHRRRRRRAALAGSVVGLAQ